MGQVAGGGGSGHEGGEVHFTLSLYDLAGNVIQTINTWPGDLMPDRAVEPILIGNTLNLLALPLSYFVFNGNASGFSHLAPVDPKIPPTYYIIQVDIITYVVTAIPLNLPSIPKIDFRFQIEIDTKVNQTSIYPPVDNFGRMTSSNDFLVNAFFGGRVLALGWDVTFGGWVGCKNAIIPWVFGSPVLCAWSPDFTTLLWSKSTSDNALGNYYTTLGSTQDGDLITVRTSCTYSPFTAHTSELVLDSTNAKASVYGADRQASSLPTGTGEISPHFNNQALSLFKGQTSFYSDAALKELVLAGNVQCTRYINTDIKIFLECIDSTTGNVKWSKSIPLNLPFRQNVLLFKGFFVAKDPPTQTIDTTNSYWYYQSPDWWKKVYGVQNEHDFSGSKTATVNGIAASDSERWISYMWCHGERSEHFAPDGSETVQKTGYNQYGSGFGYPTSVAPTQYGDIFDPGSQRGTYYRYDQNGNLIKITEIFSNYTEVLNMFTSSPGDTQDPGDIIDRTIGQPRATWMEGYDDKAAITYGFTSNDLYSFSLGNTLVGTMARDPIITVDSFMCDFDNIYIVINDAVVANVKVTAYDIVTGNFLWETDLTTGITGTRTMELRTSHCTGTEARFYLLDGNEDKYMVSLDSISGAILGALHINAETFAFNKTSSFNNEINAAVSSSLVIAPNDNQPTTFLYPK